MSGITVAKRLQMYFETKRLSMAQVSRDTGIQYDTLQQILYGRVKAMGVDKFAAIWQAYPDLDAWHILTGESINNSQRLTALTTVEELISFKHEVVQSLDRRIQELGG